MKVKQTTLTVPAHGTGSFNVSNLGVPRYGAQDLTLAVEAVSGDLASATIAPSGAEERFGEERVEFLTDSSGEVTIDPGLRGSIDIENAGNEPLVVVIQAGDWERKQRAIPAAEEAEFVASAAALGIDPAMAKMAVWDKDMAKTLPVRVEVMPGAPVARAGAPVARAGIAMRDAASGSCAAGYQLTSFNRSFAFYSTWGKLWETGFTKRWCRNATRKLVGSGYFLLRQPQFTSLGSSSYDFKGNINVDNRFTSYGGSAQGAHWSTATHHIKHCMVARIPYCDDVYHQYWVTGNFDGSKNGGWPSGADPI